MYRFEVSQKVRKFVRFFWPLIRGWVRFRDNIRSTLWSEESGSRRIFFRYFGRAQKLSDIGFFVLLWLISLYFVTTTCQLIHPSVFSSWQKNQHDWASFQDQVLLNLFHTEVWNATTRLIPYHTLRGKNMMGTGNLDFFLVWEGQLVNS